MESPKPISVNFLDLFTEVLTKAADSSTNPDAKMYAKSAVEILKGCQKFTPKTSETENVKSTPEVPSRSEPVNILDLLNIFSTPIPHVAQSISNSNSEPKAEPISPGLQKIFDKMKANLETMSSHREPKHDDLAQRLLDIVKVSISDKNEASKVIIMLSTILNKHTEKSFNGFSTQQVASETLNFLFPTLETPALNKLAILMVAPIL